MRSSSGEHFVALDHVRALAAFMVFTWHFTHTWLGHPVPFEYVPSVFFLSLLDEGHTGVALFMTLSGYLFAKLLDARTIRYRAFLWNRALRLFPLLALVIAIVGVTTVIDGGKLSAYALSIAAGVLFPTLPNGGWSITIEFHFYLMLPLFLWMVRRSRWLPLSIVLSAVLLRALVHARSGQVQSLAYWTLVGRIDQFVLGMLAFQFRGMIARRHVAAVACLVAFSLFYWYFDARGGFFKFPSYPSPSPLWIVLPTMEGIAYAVGIAWYDSSFSPSSAGVSGFIGRIGVYSYSIYLLQFFVVFRLSLFVHERVMDLSNFYVACLGSAVGFLLMVPIGHLTFRFIESPFLTLRRRYTAPAD